MRSRALPAADEASVTKCRGRQARHSSGESSGTANWIAKQLRILLPLPNKKAHTERCVLLFGSFLILLTVAFKLLLIENGIYIVS